MQRRISHVSRRAAASVLLLAKRYLSVGSDAPAALKGGIHEVAQGVRDVASFRDAILDARGQPVVFRQQVQAGGLDGSVPVNLPAWAKWFATEQSSRAPDLSAYLRGRTQEVIVPYEMLVTPDSDPRSPGSELAGFLRWLSTSHGDLHAVFQEALLPVHDGPSATNPRFIRFHAPLSLLTSALDYNRLHPNSNPLSNLYVAQSSLPDLPPDLQADVPTPLALSKPLTPTPTAAPTPAPIPPATGHHRTPTSPAASATAAAADIYASSIWLGLSPTYTPWHRDPNDNLFCQLCGTKVVRLMAPQPGATLFRRVMASLGKPALSLTVRTEEMMVEPERGAWVDAVWGSGSKGGGGDGGLLEEEKEEGMREVVLRAGDVLVLARGWWHSVRSGREDGVGRLNASVNWWFRFRQR